jgi:tRNA G46 methylase TrmB
MPRRFARVAHVYFPDPWPKARHNKRRLFDANTVDLVLGSVEIGGTLCFATDFVEYGQVVHEQLDRHPAVEVQQLDAWPEGPRTNYEAKYVIEGREILRLECLIKAETNEQLLHPGGRESILVGPARAQPVPPEVAQSEGAPSV